MEAQPAPSRRIADQIHFIYSLTANTMPGMHNYASGKFGFYVHQPDLGVLLDITSQRAQVVHDTIWEVVRTHPYTPRL